MARQKQGQDLTDMGLQSFRMEKLHRRQLQGAPYNPRLITEAEKRKLRTGIKRHGLVEPIVWNKRTGNIVGGHQRIGQLDQLAGTDDYRLDVAVINVEEPREKEINILLNNGEAQGDWDLDKLGIMLRDPALDLNGTGFDHADVFQIFGDSPIIERGADALDEFAMKVRMARERYEQISNNAAARDSEDFYLVVVFRSEADRDAFTQKHGLPENRYQSGEEIDRICSGGAAVNAPTPPAPKRRRQKETVSDRSLPPNP